MSDNNSTNTNSNNNPIDITYTVHVTSLEAVLKDFRNAMLQAKAMVKELDLIPEIEDISESVKTRLHKGKRVSVSELKHAAAKKEEPVHEPEKEPERENVNDDAEEDDPWYDYGDDDDNDEEYDSASESESDDAEEPEDDSKWIDQFKRLAAPYGAYSAIEDYKQLHPECPLCSHDIRSFLEAWIQNQSEVFAYWLTDMPADKTEALKYMASKCWKSI